MNDNYTFIGSDENKKRFIHFKDCQLIGDFITFETNDIPNMKDEILFSLDRYYADGRVSYLCDIVEIKGKSIKLLIKKLVEEGFNPL